MTSLGQACTDVLGAYLRENNKTSLGALNAKIVQELIDEKVGPYFMRKPVRAKRKVESDGQWWGRLKADPLNAGLDIEQQRQLAQRWLEKPVNRNRRFTRLFFEGWLERADRPIAELPRPSSVAGNAIQEPAGWLEWLKAERPDSIYIEATGWKEIPDYAQRKIRDDMRQPKEHNWQRIHA